MPVLLGWVLSGPCISFRYCTAVSDKSVETQPRSQGLSSSCSLGMGRRETLRMRLVDTHKS